MLKYKKDTRYSLEDVISTHDRSELAAKPVELLEEVCAISALPQTGRLGSRNFLHSSEARDDNWVRGIETPPADCEFAIAFMSLHSCDVVPV